MTNTTAEEIPHTLLHLLYHINYYSVLRLCSVDSSEANQQ